MKKAQRRRRMMRSLSDFCGTRIRPEIFSISICLLRYADVLWSLKTTAGDGYIYVVIEHQSSLDAHMAFRLMRYAIAAMQRHLDAGHQRLPLVIPMLFYHGIATPYPHSLCWLDDFSHPAEAHELYATAFPLVDITVIPDDEIARHRRVALLEFMQKHIRQRDLSGLTEPLTFILVKEYTNDSQLKTLFNDLVHSGDIRHFGQFIQ